MRRVTVAVMGAATLVMPVVQVASAASAASAGYSETAVKKTVTTRRYTGTAAVCDRWGYVQVTIKVRKTTVGRKVTRRIIDVTATWPDHTPRSVFINEQAIPLLRQEVLQAQSADIDMVSGATDTSIAFQQSLQSAISRVR